MPLSGPCTTWGLPESRGVQVWVDLINEAGGVEVAGENYILEPYFYDDTCYVPTESLKGVQKGVFDEGILIWQGTPTVGVVEAVAPFLKEQGGLWVTHGASSGIRPEWPHVMAGFTLWPQYYPMAFEYLAEQYPEVKTIAILGPDTRYTQSDQACIDIGVHAEGWDTVYNEVFPMETVDFSPVVSAILDKNPDLICLDGTPSTAIPNIMEIAKDSGYTGKWEAITWHMPSLLEKIPAEYVEGAIGSVPLLDNPDLVHPMLYAVYEEFNNRWPGEWALDAVAGVIPLSMVVEAMKMAGTTTDTVAINETLLSTDPFPHPYFGDCRWGGKELWGADHYLMTPAFVGEVKDGKHSVAAVVSFADYYEENIDIIIQTLSENGMVTAK